jgi:peptidoglycan/LPS O-acetylase OafA/YrhL
MPPEPSRPAWRRRTASGLLVALAAVWTLAALRYYFFPQPWEGPAVAAVFGLGLALNALLLVLGARWVARWQRVGVAVVLAVLAGNLVLSIHASMTALDLIALVLTVAALGLVVSLMVREEPAP